MVVAMADYFAGRVSNVIRRYSIERHWTSLNEETGGMNDVLYQLYTITKDQRHLVLAHLFDKPCFLGLLAVQMRYEVTGDPLYKEIATFFMDIVNSSHAYATGGTSVSEFWSDPKRLAEALTTETEESCTTYNMLKVSRHLFRWTKEIVYADYYERALINGVLSIQRGRDPGVMIYMLPQGPGRSKARSYHKWGTPYDSFWCCYGTGGRAGPGLSILDVAQQHRVSTFKMTICIMVNFWEKSDYGFIVPKQSFQWKVGFNCYSDKVKMKFMEINKTLIGDYMPLMRTILMFRKNDSFCSFLSCQA